MTLEQKMNYLCKDVEPSTVSQLLECKRSKEEVKLLLQMTQIVVIGLSVKLFPI